MPKSRKPPWRVRNARHEHRRPALPNIDARPDAASNLSEFGHFQAAQIIGAPNRSSIL